MKIREGFIGTVDNTPLIKIAAASEETGCTILGKAEFNPGGSLISTMLVSHRFRSPARGRRRSGRRV